MTSLVTIHENIPVVSHRVIAENTNVKAINISELIQDNLSDFEEFGQCRFKTETVKNSVGAVNQQKTYLLNEQQATLLMTYMKNSPIVREFKKALVRAFYNL